LKEHKDNSVVFIQKQIELKKAKIAEVQKKAEKLAPNKIELIEELAKTSLQRGGIAVPSSYLPYSDGKTDEAMDENSFRDLAKKSREDDRAKLASKLTKLKELTETYRQIQGLDGWKKRGRSFLDFASNRIIEERIERVTEGGGEVEKTIKVYGGKKSFDEITTLQEWIDIKF